MRKLISIVVPFYNSEKSIERTLHSIIEQSYDNFEVILVNDGSTDNSMAVVQKNVGHDKRFICVTQENQGVSCARNKGIEYIKGEYVCFWDADDTIPFYALEKMLSVIEEQGADLIVGTMLRKGNLVERVFPKTQELAVKEVIDKEDKNLLYNFSVANKLFRTDIIKKYGLKFPKLRHAEDGVFLFRYLQYCEKICGCDSIVYEYYRELSVIRESSMQKIDMQMFKDVLEALKLIENCISNNSEEFRREFYKRALKSTIIHEYYRKIWMLDDSTVSKVIEAANYYKSMLTDEQWIEIAEEMSELDIKDGLRLPEKIVNEPLITVVLTSKISRKHRASFLKSLYGQNCPNFEVLVPTDIYSDLENEYKNKQNLREIEKSKRRNNIEFVLDKARGKYITFADADILYNDNTLQLMYRRIVKWKKDFITVLMVQLVEGKRDEIVAYSCCFDKKRLKKDVPYGRDDKLDYMMANKLFNVESLKRIKILDRKTYAYNMGKFFETMNFKRFDNVLVILNYNSLKYWIGAETLSFIEKCKRYLNLEKGIVRK